MEFQVIPPSFLACTAYSMESAEYLGQLAHQISISLRIFGLYSKTISASNGETLPTAHIMNGNWLLQHKLLGVTYLGVAYISGLIRCLCVY